MHARRRNHTSTPPLSPAAQYIDFLRAHVGPDGKVALAPGEPVFPRRGGLLHYTMGLTLDETELLLRLNLVGGWVGRRTGAGQQGIA